MNTILKPKDFILAWLSLSSCLLIPSSARAAGSLTPPGPPAPTMKSLQEIEPRTLISSVPFTISAPGSYYLANNLTVATGNGIVIATNGVTLDLNGFTISSTAPSANGSGIAVNGSIMNITILNGFIQSSVSDSGSNNYSGPGFFHGIYSQPAVNLRVTGVSVAGCLNNGIYLSGSDTLVERCMVNTIGGTGITAGTVVESTAVNCGGNAIYATKVLDCYGQSPYGGIGIYAQIADNCIGSSASYYGIYASVSASHCYGTSVSGYYGLYTTTANNCCGIAFATNGIGILAYNITACYAVGGADGIYAYGTVNGSYGTSANGDGIYACATENCYGSSSAPAGSTAYAGIYSYTALNCYGSSYYQNGVQINAGNNCFGTSTYGFGITGISAHIATLDNSHGYSYNNDGIHVATANNCYGESWNAYGIAADTVNNCRGLVNGGNMNYTIAIAALSANNCYGVNQNNGNNGIGISAYVANNCEGISYSNYGTGVNSYCITTGCYGEGDGTSATGLFSNCIATSCYGSGTGTGLNAYIANSCYGSSETVSYKYNMP